jgi:hypothetical protein
MTGRYHITLLQNQFLTLRQIRIKSDGTVSGYELIVLRYASYSFPTFQRVLSTVTQFTT